MLPSAASIAFAGCEDDPVLASDELARTKQEVARLQNELDRAHRECASMREQQLHLQRMGSAGTLAAGLAHDMNNILASILGFTELLLDQRHSPEVRADLEQIVAAAERGAGLTRSLLAFSRKGQYRKQVLELDPVIRSALSLLSRSLPKSITVDAQLGAGPARVEADPVTLSQVLVNLAINASQAMDGKGRLSIATSQCQLDETGAAALEVAAGSYVVLTVADTGCGMDEAVLQRIFEPFFTTKPLGTGTGLGLSLVWGVVKSHHGAIRVWSQPGVGSTFTVYIPLSDGALPVGTHAPQLAAPITPTTILVVDDEPAVRQGSARILGRVGYEVLTAADGREALAMFDTHRDSIGMVVLDMAMPVMGGAECFRELRKRTSIPVLIVTGFAQDEEMQELIAAGAELLEKPFASTSLIVHVTRMLKSETCARRKAHP